MAWKDRSFTLPVDQALVLAYDIRIDGPPAPQPYENLVEARLSTGQVLYSTALVEVVEEAQVSDPEPISVTPTLTVTEPVTEPTPEPSPEPSPEPTTEPTPVIEPTPEPVIEPTPEPTPEPVSDSPPVTETESVDVPTEEAPTRITEGPFWLYMPIAVRTEAQYRIAYESNPSGSNWEVYAVDASGTNRVNVSNLSGGDGEPAWSPGRTKIAWVHYFDGNGEIYVANADGSNKQNLTNNSARDWMPAWSPDGTEIAFTSMRDGVREIYKMNADGSGVQKLTSQLCQSYAPVWSPDGGSIAFICGLWYQEQPLHEIYIMSANGTNERRLTVDDHPGCEDEDGEPVDCPHYEDTGLTWAPDSRWLAYTKYFNKKKTKGDIYKIDTSLGSPEQVNLTNTETAEHSPDWAQAGGKIAFSAYLDGTYEIATMNADGSNVTNLTHAALADYRPKWSSDAAMIAFLSNRAGGSLELYSMNADGTGQTRLTTTDEDEDNPSWRP
jgi:TolB protein